MKIINKLNNICITNIEYINDTYIIKIEVLDSFSYVKKVKIQYNKNEAIIKIKFTKFKFLRYKRDFLKIKTNRVDKIIIKTY